MNSPDPKLMQIFNFTASDLLANRAGELSGQQREKIAELFRVLRPISYGFLLIGVIAVPLFLVDFANWQRNPESFFLTAQVFLILKGALIVIMPLFFLLLRWQKQTMLKPGIVRYIDGEFGIGHVKLQGRTLEYLRVGEKKFDSLESPIDIDLLRENLPDGIYRVYYTRLRNYPLSAERIE